MHVDQYDFTIKLEKQSTQFKCIEKYNNYRTSF